MTGVPDIIIEQEFGGSWVDVTSRRADSDGLAGPMEISRGVGDSGDATPSSFTLALINDDGALTPSRSASVYYPNVTRYRRIRLKAYIAGAWRDRFTGFVDTERLTWVNPNAAECLVNLTAIDALGMAAGKLLRSVAAESTAARGPLAYWPLTDNPAGSEQSGNAARAGLVPVQIGTGGEASAAGGVELPTDGAGGVVFTPATTVGAVDLRSSVGIDLPDSWALSVFPTPADKDGYVVQIGTDSYSLGIWYDVSAKKFSAIETLADSSGDPVDYVLSTTTATWAGGMETMTVTPTTVKLGSSSTTGTRHNDDTMLGSLVSVGGGQWVETGRDAQFSGEVKHLAVWSGTVPSGHSADVLTGPTAMLTLSTAISTIMGWAGVPVTVVTLGSDRTVVLAKTDGMSAMDLMSHYARGTMARIFCDGSGQLVVAAWDYTPTPLVAPSGEISPGSEWGSDPTADVQSVVMTWPDGTTYTATDGVGIGSLDLPGVLPTAEGQSVAEWTVGAGNIAPRFPSATFDLMTLSNDDLALADIGDTLTIPGLPTQLPSASESGAIETISETLGVAEWSRTFTTSADAGKDRLFIVGDATRGVVGDGYMVAPLGPNVTATSSAWHPGEQITAANLNADGYTGGQMQSGTLTITPTANTPTSAALTFPTVFTSTPAVVARPQTDKPGSEVQGVSVSSVSTTGCTVWVYRTNTTPVVIHWAAVN